MALLYVASVSTHSGKNLLCLGLGRRMLNDGLKVGYTKPFGGAPMMVGDVTTDAAAWEINNILELGQSPQECCPVPRTQDLVARTMRGQTEGLLEKAVETCKALEARSDVVIISGSGTLASGASCRLDCFSILEALDSTKVLLVDRYDTNFFLDNIMLTAKFMRPWLVGVVMNGVEQHLVEPLEQEVIPYLERHQVQVLGWLPHDELLGGMEVEEIKEILGARIISGMDYIHRVVTRFFIGAMQVRHAPRFFQGARDFACIVGGDRPDMQLAAIESGAACLILTGNFYPNDIILSRAEEHQVPVLIVREDTFTVAHKVEHGRHRGSLRGEAKLKRAMELVLERIDFDSLYKALGL